MPVANKYSIAQLMEACSRYYQKTGRQITFEYSLISGVNDGPAQAQGLAELAKPLKAHINLIPVNPVREREFVRPDNTAVQAFKKKLEINGVGYRCQKQGKKLVLTLGFSHPVEFEDTADYTLESPDPNTIIVKGIDNQIVGQIAAVIREKRPPEPYKGKGIKYADEVIRRKEGKTGSKK